VPQFTILNSFSSINLYDFEFQPISNGYDLKKEKVLFDNGLKFYLYNFLRCPKDLSFNNKTGFFLTDLYTNSDIFEFEEPRETALEEIESPLINLDGNIFKVQLSGLYISNFDVANKNDNIKFIFEDDYVKILNIENNYLTCDGSLTEVKFSYNVIGSDLQKFDYILNDDNILLFAYNTNKSKYIDASTNPISIKSHGFNQTFFNNKKYYFGFYSYRKSKSELKSNKEFLVRYNNDPIENSPDQLKYIEDENSKSYKQNYMLMFPYEYQKNSKYPFYLHALKNYQTPEYEYSNGYSGYENKWIKRKYEKIFTGTNQDGGYENVYLDYVTKTKIVRFETDKFTKFFYPIFGDKIHIQDSGLIEDGANAGKIPFESDKVFLNKMNYSDVIPILDSLPKQSFTKYDNTWACAWLSANEAGDKIWMDRYYNAAYYTYDAALTSYRSYYEKYDPSKEYVWDEPSKMYFEPGVRYMYYRVGEETLKKYLDSFVNSEDENGNTLLLHVDKWNSTELKDSSNYKNDGFLFYNDNDENLKGDYLVLDGKNHAVFPSSETLLNTEQFTVNLWINVKDWSKIEGKQIFGNFYDSGYGLLNGSSLTAPVFTLSENTSALAITSNYKINVINTTPLSVLTNRKNKIIQRLSNFDCWIFDCFNLVATKYDIEGKILTVTTNFDILNTYLNEITQVEIDEYENLYLFDKNTKNLVILNPNGEFLGYQRLGKPGFQINVNSQIILTDSDISAIDSGGIIWEALGNNLYKDKKIYGTIGVINQISFDDLDNLWILHDQDKVTKLNTKKDLFEFTYRLGIRTNLAENECLVSFIKENKTIRTINFLRIPKNSNGDIHDVAVIIDIFENQCYIMDQKGKLLNKIPLKAFTENPTFQFYAEGDFTGYQYLRKFESSGSYFSWKFKLAQPNSLDSRLYNLNYKTENLYKGWHQFTFVFDSINGYAKSLIDGIEVERADFDKEKYSIYFNYKSNLLLGVASIKNKILNDVLNINDSYKFIGDVSDLRIYSKALSNSQVRNLFYTNGLSDRLAPLDWNFSVGERNYIEKVTHWFKMQLTGSKSKYFNIKIHNLNLTDEQKSLFENTLKNVIEKISPSYTNLNKIDWL
jgi:hypothetical protein